MKLSLIAAAALATFALACNGTSDDAGPAPKITEAEPPPQTPPASTPRKLVDGNALATSPTNLLLDPGFGLVGQQAGFGSFLAFDDSGFSTVDYTATTDSRSPAGFGGGVAILPATSGLMLLSSFPGGDGPFHAQVWVSKSDAAGNAVDVPTDKKLLRASVADENPDGTAYDLEVVDGATRVTGGRTWVLLRATIPNAIPYGGFFVVRVGKSDGKILVAAPELVADAVDGAVPTKSLTTRATVRPVTASERSAITKYRKIPPRLVPAQGGVKRAF